MIVSNKKKKNKQKNKQNNSTNNNQNNNQINNPKNINSISMPRFIKQIILVCCFLGVCISIGDYFNIFRYFEDSVQIYFLDVGQGDCIVIQDAQNCYVIDGGGTRLNSQSENTGVNVIIPFLLEKNIHRVDCVFISHFHYDHVKGVLELLKDFPIGAIAIANIDRYERIQLENKEDESAQLYQEVVELAQKEGIKLLSMQEEDKIIGKNVTISCVYPLVTSLKNENENNNSLVLLIDISNFQLLLTGDIEASIEDVLLDKIHEFDTINMMKVAHHGSKTSSTLKFIQLLMPDIAILSVGVNMFGHPHKNTLELFGELEIPLYSTKNCGMIEVKVSKNSYTIQAFKGELLNEAIKGTYKTAKF